jgi:thiamine biosynthesis lipoprotein
MKYRSILILSLLLLQACGNRQKSSLQEGEAGTYSWQHELVGGQETRDTNSDLALSGTLLETNARELLVLGQGSQIAQINALAGSRSGRLSRPNYDLILRMLQYKKESQESIEMLAGPLRRLWGAHDGGADRPWPGQADVDSVLALVHEGGTYFVDLSVLLRLPGMEIDLDPVLAGTMADRSLDSLRKLGYMDQLIRVEDTWRAIGKAADGKDWSIALINPANQQELGRIPLKEQAIALVHAGQQATELGGRAASSLVDPKTGMPATQVLAAWVIAPTAEAAHAWAYALAILGQEKGLPLIETHAGFAAAVIEKTDKGPIWRASRTFPLAEPSADLLAGGQ